MQGLGWWLYVYPQCLLRALSSPGPTHKPAEPGRHAASPTGSVEEVKDEVAGFRIEWEMFELKGQGSVLVMAVAGAWRRQLPWDLH